MDVAELSRLYGVSRQTAHVWIKRYQAAGHDLRVMQDRVVAARKQHPRWGPLKLRAWLVERHPQLSFPSVSGIAAVLRRRGMTAARKPRRSASIPATIAPPFAESTGCRNDCAPMVDLPSFQRPHLRACLDSGSGSSRWALLPISEHSSALRLLSRHLQQRAAARGARPRAPSRRASPFHPALSAASAAHRRHSGPHRAHRPAWLATLAPSSHLRRRSIGSRTRCSLAGRRRRLGGLL